MTDPTIVAVIVLAMIFDFFNGFHDSSNIVATMICSGATSPRVALILASVAEFSGPFLFGVAVAATIGQEVVALDVVPIAVVLSMLVSAIDRLRSSWGLPCWEGLSARPKS